MCEVVDCQPSSSPDGGEGELEEEEDNGIHWMTAVQLAAYEAVNGSHCPAQTKAAQLPVVKPRVSLKTEEEEEDVESLFFHGPCHGQHERLGLQLRGQ